MMNSVSVVVIISFLLIVIFLFSLFKNKPNENIYWFNGKGLGLTM